MIIGYNTNGLAYHEPFEALHLLADIGYRSVAITIDHGWLSPRDPSHELQLQKLKHFLSVNGFTSVIDSGARFLLDPAKKYAPSLLDPDPSKVANRVDFLKYCIDVGVELSSNCVALTSGVKPEDVSFSHVLDQLVRNLEPVIHYAEERNIDLGLKPEPGMLIDSTGRFERLIHLADSERLNMSMDISHLFRLSEVPIVNYIERWQDYLVNICIADTQAGVNDHLMLGDGQIYFPPIIESLLAIGYCKGVHIELSKHSHNAAAVARHSFDFLNPIIQDAKSGRVDD